MPYNYKEKDLLKHQLKGEEPKRTFQGINNVSAILAKHNIVPLIKHVDEGAILGSGKFGTVFRAVVNSKEVAVKISSNTDDAIVWQSILEVIDGMPPELKKHFPKIYNIIKDRVVGVDTGYQQNISIIMEILAPLDREMKGIFDGHHQRNKRAPPLSLKPERGSSAAVAELMKDPQILYQAFLYAIDTVYPLDSISPDAKQRVFKPLLSFKPLSNKSNLISALKSYISPYITQEFNLYMKENPDANPSDLQYAVDEFVRMLINRIADQSILGQFPKNYEREDQVAQFRDVPEYKSLIMALEYLKDKGIYWRDLHANNLMMRPSTGDIVIVDVGLFDIEGHMF